MIAVNRLFAAMSAMSLVTTASLAQAEKFLDGAYGNKEGCTYARTGESSGADVFFLLDDKGITTATAYCEFKDKAVPSGNGFKVRAQCESEGETGALDMVDLTKSAKGYSIAFKDGTRWGPLPKCK